MIGWGFDASWSPEEALPTRLKPMHKTTRCISTAFCVWIHSGAFSLSRTFYSPHLAHMRRPVLQTKIGRQEYRKDSFCLGVGRWGGIRTQKKNQLEEKEGKKTNTHTHKKKVTMHGWSFYKCGGGGDFTELWFPTRPTRHIRTFGISHQTAQISNRYIHSAAQLCIIGFPSQQSTDKEKTSHRPPITKPFFGGKKEKVKLTTSHFCQKILMVCLIESVVCKVSGEGDRLFLGLW